jgi:Ran GTPase-activating protein (RanGAP) involved in mRNA processing and transport
MVLFSICRRVQASFRRRAILDVSPSSTGTTGISFGEDEESTLGTGTECFEAWFFRVCEAVQRNDPSIEELEIDCGESSLFDDTDMMAIACAMRNNTVVSHLVFRNIAIDGCSAQHLQPMLMNTKSISSLRLEEIRGEGPMAVALALSLNPTSSIRTLHLEGSAIDMHTAQALGLMLKSNRTLEELRLCHSSICSEGVSSVAIGLMGNRSLKSLDLSGNRLDDLAVSKISNSLAHNETLDVLRLDFNEVGSLGAQAIASTLRRNRCLQELHLFGNQIDSEGAVGLADALQHNASLNTLILSFNNIGDRGAEALANSLKVNVSLTKLSFASNGIGKQGLKVFGHLLPQMKGLEQLDAGDFYDAIAAEALLEGLKFNTRLSVLYFQSPISECLGSSTVEDELDFYIRLNKSGRSLLHTPQGPASIWSAALAKANVNQSELGSPDVLYHLLREKPDLMEATR